MQGNGRRLAWLTAAAGPGLGPYCGVTLVVVVICSVGAAAPVLVVRRITFVCVERWAPAACWVVTVVSTCGAGVWAAAIAAAADAAADCCAESACALASAACC